jgi:hypothetical protein
MSDVVSNLDSAAKWIQHSKLPVSYDPSGLIGPNSNSLVSSVLQQAGASTPTPAVNAPGYGHQLGVK